MNIVLVDVPQIRVALLPFAFTRPLSHIRVGIMTIQEKWQYFLQGVYSFLTEAYLSKKFPLIIEEQNLFINATVCPDVPLVAVINKMQCNEVLMQGDLFIAALTDNKNILKHYFFQNTIINSTFKRINYEGIVTRIKNKWDIFLLNEQEMMKDFGWITTGRSSQGIQDKYTIVYNKQNIFIEDNVIIKAAVLNAEKGPIYIGKHVVINEGAVIKGPVAICEGSQISMHASLHNGTTIGSFSKVGGEVDNSVIFGNSNKVHEGFMGHSVIGEWCNIGAGTNISNLKNDYSKVKVWDDVKETLINTNLQFCGLFMGDHSKCGINTMTNAGTILGVSVNLFGSGFCDRSVPSFTWGGTPGLHTTTYGVDKALEVAERSIQRKQKISTLPLLSKEDKDILANIFRMTTMNRTKGTI